MPYVTSIERRAIEKGREEGRKEGQIEGRMQGLLQAIELGLKLKFGPAGLALMPAVRQQARLETLEVLVQALETATNVEELRHLLQPEPSWMR